MQDYNGLFRYVQSVAKTLGRLWTPLGVFLVVWTTF